MKKRALHINSTFGLSLVKKLLAISAAAQVFLLALTLISGCASDVIKNSDNPETIYKAAKEYVDKSRFLEAGELINEIRTRFPQSRFAALAELQQADMLFKQDLYTEAAAAYGVFGELYPTHADAPYALYQKALSYYNDAPDEVARDQAPAADAASAAVSVVSKYPTSTFVEKAKELEKKARLKLANKEAYIAHFYEHRKAKKAALDRWQGLQKEFADISSIPEGASLLKLASASIAKLEKEVDSSNK